MTIKTKLFSTLTAAFVAVASSFAGNTVTSVEQVTSPVTITGDEDYTITSETPFTTAGYVDITNTDHAVVIIKKIKPSKVISSWLRFVKINGAAAKDGVNCQVKMYGRGAIIFPYASNIKPLTVYSEQNFGGESCNAFGLENSGGYMNTLTDAKLNNKIRSFKLKRGYMVTFSTQKEGRGYSRCFIADKEDLEFSTMPTILDKTISSYRVFHWYNAKKAGLASDTRADANNAVNSSWCYSWGTGESRLPDAECVPNHIYEDWPSASACGSVTYSCHMKTNNEPGNSADDHPQDVATVLANWQNLMRTGMRLCSESSHDGSMAHLKAFIDSIDARGWRCDLLDLHCYWPQGTFNNLTWYSDYYGNGRPIWISEWVWGASWNNNGAFSVSNRDDYKGNWQNNYNGTKPILDVLNANSRVERYAFWNSEANCSKIYLDGQLSTLGEYYANMDDGLGYNPANEYIPKNPPMKAPKGLSVEYDKANGKVILKWHDYNGEYNQVMEIREKKVGTLVYSTVQEVETQEVEADYTIAIDGKAGNIYQIRVKDANNTWQYSNEVTAVNENLEYGDQVSVSETESGYLGGNQIINGDFEFGTTGWTNGKGETLSAPDFQVVPLGGADGGKYLQCYGSGSSVSDAQAVRTILDIETNTYYYVSCAGLNCNPDKQTISVSLTNTAPGTVARIKMPSTTKWTNIANAFKTNQQKYLWISLCDLGGKAQVDEFMVCKLFQTREDALADALVWAKKRAEAFLAYNTWYADLNTEIQGAIDTYTNANELEMTVKNAITTIKTRQAAEALEAITTDAERTIPEGLNYSINNTSIQSGSFSSTTGWTTKCGTYTGGDQKLTAQAGKPCWNAWWNISAEGNEDKTMAISQVVPKLAHGLYALECKATTQHLCENDQHAYLTYKGTTLNSINLPVGLLDINTFSDDEKWQTLCTSYIYVEESDTVIIGFTGSKAGTTDGTWRPYSNTSGGKDNRQGWWCATDFQFRYIPLFKQTTDASGWGTLCLPYSASIPEGMSVYKCAGILADSTRICLEPVDAIEAAECYVYQYAPNAEFTLIETGTKVSSAKTNSNGLRGMFVPSPATKYPLKCLVLTDGAWTVVKERYTPSMFSAYIYASSSDVLKNLKRIDSWTGVSLPTSGLVSVDGIENVMSDKIKGDVEYDLTGKRVGSNKKGVVISNKKKVIK